MTQKVSDEKRTEIHRLLDVYVDALAEIKPRMKAGEDTEVMKKVVDAQDKFHHYLFNMFESK